jgi:hypothetical protein
MNKILISFATNYKWERAQHALNKTAKPHGFTHYISYNVQNINKNFYEHHKDILKNEVRGFGFWMWKAAIIKQTLDMVNDGDIVAYIDSGNVIISSLNFIFNECTRNNIVLFDNRDGNFQGEPHKNKTWTKRDTFVLMGLDNEKWYNTNQVDASYQFYKKTDFTNNFIDEYLKFSENINIISDLPNITKNNLPEFKDHRHDQSILSLMAAKYNIKTYPEPSEWGNHLQRPYPQLFWHHRGVF